VPENILENATPLQLQGALVFQYKNCRNCHALEGSGGKRGPDLTTVGTRLTENQLIDQISNGTPSGIGDPGGGNMPAYGKQISPSEMTALVDYLSHLTNGQPAARSSAAAGASDGMQH
jgi:ubiquinol-cytochrome c reductase cytochrome b subunit